MSTLLQSFQKWKSHPGLFATRELDDLFLKAVAEKDVTVASALLAGGANVNAEDSQGASALETAAHEACVPMLKLLLDSSARSEKAFDAYGTTALHATLIKSEVAAARVLIEAGCDVTAIRENHETTLHLAARIGDVDLLRLLLAKGAGSVLNVATERYGVTPLFAAIYNGRQPCVELLLAEGALVNVSDSKNETPLGAAIRLNLEDIAVKLLAAHADPNMPAGRDGEMPLLLAIAHKRFAIARELLIRGADPAAKDGTGRSALGLAAREGDSATLRLLLSFLPPDIFAPEEYTMGLYDAAFYNHPAAAATLLKSGRADPNLRTSFNRSALEAAVENNNPPMAQLLIIGGADPEGCDISGHALSQLAAKRGFQDMEKLLHAMARRSKNNAPPAP